MQLGIHVGTFRRETLEETLDAVVKHRLRYVHFNMAAAGVPSMPEKIDDELAERIAAALSERELAVASLSGTFNMIHPNENVRRAGQRRLETLASRAGQFGAKLITLCTGTRDADDMWRRHDDNDTPEAWADLRESLEQALDTARRYDLTLGIEPEVGNVIDSAAKAHRLLNEMHTPRLKIVMDGANLFHSGELPAMRKILTEALELLGEDVAVAHAKDLDRDGQAGNIPAGKGVLDYDLYLDLLKQAGFDGPLVLHSLREDDVSGCLAFFREKLEEGDD